MAVITTGNWPKLLWPGLNAIWGKYQELPTQWTDLYETATSTQAFEEEIQGTGFPMARVKAQGAGIEYVTDAQGYLVRYTHITYALGFIVTWEEEQDNLYKQVAFRRTKNLAFSMRQTKENIAANGYNFAFDATNQPGGDAVAWCSASHPSAAGNQSNVGTADLSETALEDMMVQIMNATNNEGLHIGLQAVSLHVAPANFYEANRIMKSVLQNDSSLNAVNVLKSTNALPGGIKVNNYFNDSDAYFIRTNCPDGLKCFERNALAFAEDNDFDTKNHKYSAMERYSFGQSDWRSLYGSPGA